MARAGRPGSAIALYVWDYAAGMELMRLCWDAARALRDPQDTADGPDGSIRLAARAWAVRGFKGARQAEPAVPARAG